MNSKTRRAACEVVVRQLVQTVEATGGIVKLDDDGNFTCAHDEDWIDLAFLYLEACKALEREPQVVGYADSYIPPEDDDEDPETIAKDIAMLLDARDAWDDDEGSEKKQ